MSASEFAFLALGLLLGVASGAAIVEVLRSRPPAPSEVRVTVTPGSVPVRSTTLAGDPFAVTDGPARLGPADRRLHDRPDAGESSVVAPGVLVAAFAGAAAGGGGSASGAIVAPRRGAAAAVDRALPDVPDRTPVPSPGRAPVPLLVGGGFVASAADGPIGGSGEPDDGGEPRASAEGRALVGIPIRPEADDRFADLRPASAVAVAARVATAVADPPDDATSGDRSPDVPRAMEAGAGPGPSAATAATSSAGPCGELIAVAEDRCAVAERAREGALAAADAFRAARRGYDEHLARADEANARSDPRAVMAAKEAAHAAFRLARDTAGDREALDAAAAAWLAEVNRINADAREGGARAARERSAANAMVTVLERLEAEAAAARISAESAHEACLAARQAVADCQEAADAQRAAEALAASGARPGDESRGGPVDRYPEEAPDLEPVDVAPGGRRARILRMLDGDGDAVRRTAADLGGGDPDAAAHWQLVITGLLDAITAQAIDAGAVDLPDEHPFWEPFTQPQRRDILAALASLGYRFDGLGGFADGRVPSQRDLSLAVGYAGLDPMRIRRWPNEHEMPALIAGARPDSGGYLASAAGGMTLGEVVGLLDRRADALTEVWNDWGRVRPLLLAID